MATVLKQAKKNQRGIRKTQRSVDRLRKYGKMIGEEKLLEVINNEKPNPGVKLSWGKPGRKRDLYFNRRECGVILDVTFGANAKT